MANSWRAIPNRPWSPIAALGRWRNPWRGPAPRTPRCAGPWERWIKAGAWFCWLPGTTRERSKHVRKVFPFYRRWPKRRRTKWKCSGSSLPPKPPMPMHFACCGGPRMRQRRRSSRSIPCGGWSRWRPTMPNTGVCHHRRKQSWRGA